MYLKRLELQGFKSFQSRTAFEFGPGMTAVVGPNGSGKSNVAESIRWVLGEQTSRNVRARRLEDVIFSGSSQKAAVGMAEVSITLDNAESWLPVDYSEVVVSRRAYRSGESEYLINKSKVRLRDIVDLFARAQVGQNSYAFMGQGLVEEVLLMRPEERRRLLEEAADVRLLRSRLDEARDRLAATRENLERVNLLIEEIAPRLRQLERQAQHAARHGELAVELADTLRALYGQLWLDAQEALTTARANLDQRTQDQRAVQQESKACEDGLTALNAAIEEQERELEARRDRRRDLDDRTHALEQRLAFDEERLAAQTRRRGELDEEAQLLRSERVDLQRSIAALRERERSILPEIEGGKGIIASRRQELGVLDQEQGSLRRRIAEGEYGIERAQRAVAEAEAALLRLGDEDGRAQSEGLRREAQKREILAGLVTIGRDFRQIEAGQRALAAEAGELEQERSGLAVMSESSRAAAQRLEAETGDLAARLAQLKARHELLLRLQRTAAGLDAGPSFLLGEASEDQGPRHAVEGLLGLVRDVVRVPPGLERAIEAALAENLEALIFQDAGAALAALEMLEERQAGRVVIYPLDLLRATPPLNILRERGVVGVAARLVRCENRFRPLVDALLGRTIVVETVALAQQVLRRGLGAVVTMDGVLLRPSGAISGGQSQAATESFSRQRELDELPAEIEVVEASLEEAGARLQRESDSYEGAAAALATAERRLQALREERAVAQNSLIENRGRLILLRSEARILWQELRQGESRRDGGAQREALRRDAEAGAAEAARVAEALEQEREALTTLTARRAAAIDALTEAAAAEAELEGEARASQHQAETLEAAIARAEAQIEGREEQARLLEAEIKAREESGAAATAELEAAGQELAALSAEMEPAEGEFSHLVSRERSMREQLAAAHGRLLASERSQLEAEAAVKLRSEESDALSEHLAGEGFQAEGDSVLPLSAGPGDTQGGLPPVRGGAAVDTEAVRSRIADLRREIRGLGPVNEQAPTDYDESKERYEFLSGQVEDLQGSEVTLLSATGELETNIRERLKTTFAVVDREFQRYFEAFFDGGKAALVLTQPDDYANTGIDISAQPPGKRVNTLAMLSGGERALTALALLLSLLEANPSPICVLDEVDAALDEANVGRFVDALRELAEKTQFIVVTHNPRTIEAAGDIYGISMGADSTSKVLSLRLGDRPQS